MIKVDKISGHFSQDFCLKMKRCFFSIGYWLVHFAGIFPVRLKTSKKRDPAVFYDRKTSWTPWTATRRSLVFGIFQVIVILYDSTRLISRRARDLQKFQWSRNYFRKFAIDVTIWGRASVTICAVVTGMLRRREVERLLNDVCSLYFDVFRHTDPPEIRKFTFLITYAVLTCSVNTMAMIISADSSSASPILDFLWQLPYTLTLLYVHIVLGVMLIYLQTAVEGLNREIKRQFPRVDEWDLKSWKPTDENEDCRKVESLKSAKYFMEEYRRTFRGLGKIVDEVNSVCGFVLLTIVLFNQMACQLLAFVHNSLFVTNSPINFVGENYRQAVSLALGCVWFLVTISEMCHSFEIVVREAQVTTGYIASIDASEIDQASKTELLEFIDEIDGSGIKFMACNIFSLDYPTLYLMLSSTVTYIIIVIQYLSV